MRRSQQRGQEGGGWSDRAWKCEVKILEKVRQRAGGCVRQCKGRHLERGLWGHVGAGEGCGEGEMHSSQLRGPGCGRAHLQDAALQREGQGLGGSGGQRWGGTEGRESCRGVEGGRIVSEGSMGRGSVARKPLQSGNPPRQGGT